jgi:hypothetical protein
MRLTSRATRATIDSSSTNERSVASAATRSVAPAPITDSLYLHDSVDVKSRRTYPTTLYSATLGIAHPIAYSAAMDRSEFFPKHGTVCAARVWRLRNDARAVEQFTDSNDGVLRFSCFVQGNFDETRRGRVCGLEDAPGRGWCSGSVSHKTLSK